MTETFKPRLKKPGPEPRIVEGLCRSVFLPQEQWALLDARAREQRLTRSEYVRRLVEEHVK